MENREPQGAYIYRKKKQFGGYTVKILKSPQCSKILDYFYTHKSLLQGFAIALGLLTILSTSLFFIEYKYYAAVVDERLAAESLHNPPGIYASPVHISVGKPISKEDLKERLLKADYIEGTESDEFANGHFIIRDDAIEIHSTAHIQSRNIPAIMRVSFATQAGRNKVKTSTGIRQITNEQTRETIRDFLLPAEMLTSGDENRSQTRRATSFDELPKHLIDALCAIEDRRFFEHKGVDLTAIVRAFFRNLREGEVRQGASTITQQLVKNMFLSAERTYQRKFAEALMAMAIERRLSKEQIMTLYCEHIYLGQSRFTAIYGFKQAAQVYFGKKLSELTLAEAATLAGMAKAPNRFSPYAKAEDATARRNLVLDCMSEADFINLEQAAAAKAEKLTVLPAKVLDNSYAPHFVDYLKTELARRNIDEENIGRYRIESSLDPELQKAATQVVNTHLERLGKMVARRGEKPEAALLAIDPHSGRILAMVGGRDYTSSQLNRVTDAMRQPGSVFKPFVYAAALANGISPASMFDNSPQEFHYGYKAVYRPGNYHDSYTHQPLMLREGIVRSSNVVSVAAALRVGLGRVAEMAKQAGLPIPNTYPSMALGAFEATPMNVAQAYTTFANDGTSVVPFGIESVTFNKTVIAGGSPAKTAILTPAAAYVVTDTLADVVNRGTAARIRQLGYKGPAAGKTGTSRDAWFVGYTPNLLVVVWVGNDDNRDLGLTGGEAAVPIWTDFVKQALALRADLSAENFSKPAGIQTMEIDSETGMIANEYCPNRIRLAMPSYLSVGLCYQHNEQIPMADETIFVDGESDEPADEIDIETMEKELDKMLRELERSNREADEGKPRDQAVIIKDAKSNTMRRYD
jgi:penicillin-binding protein 1B